MRKIVAAITTTLALVAGVLFSTGAFASAITSLSLVNSWSVNGRVSATAIVGDKVVVGGSFTTATSPSGQTAPRNNIAAFDLRTGALLSSFSGGTDGTVRALSYNGSRLFVGGSFTNVGGSYRARLAELDPTTGATRSFTANANSHVYALASTGSRLYVGGAFSTIDGVSQSRLAAIDLGSGNVQGGFSPGFNDSIFALALSSDASRLYVGGQFTTVAGGGNHSYLVELAASSGSVDSTVYSVPSLVMGLAVGTYANRVYAAFGGVGNQGAAYDTTNGARLWRVYVMGDTQAVAAYGGNVVFGFHEGYNNDTNKKFLIVPESSGVPSSVTATMPQFMGVFAISLNSWAMVVGGEISYVNGQRHTGIAIFHTATPPPISTTTTTSATTTTTARPTSTTSTTRPPSTTTTTAPGTTTTVPVSTGTVLKPFGSVWKYNDTATSTPSGWTSAGYNDSSWPSGPAALGAGNGDEATTVANRWNTTNLTTWFRGSINLSGVPTAGVTLGLVADDGAVVYINGVEVGRYNMPGGTPLATTAASAWVTGANEYAVNQITVPASRLTAGTNVIAVEIHRASAGDGDIRFDMQISANSAVPTSTTTTAATTTTARATTTTAPASTTTTLPVSSGTMLTSFGSVWKYNDTATSTPSGWTASGYNDGSWASGAGALGAGNGDETTTVANRWNTTNLTTWFRRSINLAAVPTAGVTLGLVADDGAVVYINGVEVGRYNMPGGTPSATTAASAWITGADEYAINQITVPASKLTAGTNVIAVEIHRASAGDGDLRFDMQISANSTAPLAAPAPAPALAPAPTSTTAGTATSAPTTASTTTAPGSTSTGGGSVSTASSTTTTAAMSTTGSSTTTATTAPSSTTTTPPTSTTTTAPATTTTAPTTTTAATTTTASTTTTSSTTTSSTTTSTSSTTTSTSTSTTAPQPITLLPYGAMWRYNDTAASTPPSWFSPSYSDSTWKIGAAVLGSGNGDERTVVANRWNTADVTTWFRTTVNLGFTPTRGINIGLVADDGAAIYVNGVEVARDNLPMGALNQNTLASSWRTGAAEYAVQTFTIPAAAMHAGTNVIAVEVHRAAVNDGDIRFDLTMSS